MNNFQPLGRVLAGLGITPEEHEPTTAELLALPSREALQAGLDSAAPGFHQDWYTRRLRWWDQREQLAAESSCPDCLGSGGFDHCVLATRDTDPLTGLARAGSAVLGDNGEPLIGFRRYCDCLAGRALHQEHSDKGQRQAAEREHARRERQIEQLWSGSGIPDDYRQYSLDNYPATPATAKILERVKALHMSPIWLFLEGPYGRGKTSLAVSVAMDWLSAGHSVIFRTFPDLLYDLRRTFNSKEPDAEGKVMDALLNVELLILDDLGKENPTGWAAERLYMLVNHRYLHRKRTIITSNIPLAKLHEKMDPAIAQRIGQRCQDDSGKRVGRVSFTEDAPNLRLVVAS